MRPSHATELAAATAAALQWLDHYVVLLEELIRSPGDTLLYSRNSDTFDAMRGLTASLPQVRVCWVEVLISRFELLDALGPARADPDGQVASLHQKHLQTLDHFRRLCGGCISIDFATAPQAQRPACDPGPETPLQGAQRRLLEGQRRVQQQREVIERLEARAADAAAARRVLRAMENALEAMRSNLNAAGRKAG